MIVNSGYLNISLNYLLRSLFQMIRDSLRCLFSPHNEVVVASLEFLDKVVSSPLTALDLESFYPQQSCSLKSDMEEQEIVVPTSLPSSRQFLWFHI